MTTEPKGTREKVLHTVTELFLRNGYHGTGVQEIGKAVNLGRGALYHHIGSKEQILFDISMSLLNKAMSDTLPFVSTDEPADVKLRNISRALLRHHAHHGDGWQIAVREARFLTPEHQEQVLEARKRFEQIWDRVLHEGADQGLWRQVDDIDVKGVLGLFNYTGRWLRERGPVPPDEVADRYVEMLLRGLVPRE